MSTNPRLNEVLAAGLKRPAAPTGMGATSSAMPNMYASGTSTRVVLKIAGLTNRIKPEKLKEGLAKVIALVRDKAVTTIVWDGDLLNYRRKDGSLPTLAFTAVLPVLHEQFPQLEFIYFKKQKSLGKLLASAAPSEDDHGNMLGPYDFLTFGNTENLKPTEGIPPHPKKGQNYAVGFSDDIKWYQLGLAGLQWLKNVVGVDSIHYFVLGMGTAVEREILEVANNPESYPSGIAKKSVQFLGVEIKDARAAY
jgi:hypothetical protein